MEWGKTYTGRGDAQLCREGHRTYFDDWGKIGVGTPHNIKRKGLAVGRE